MKFKSLMSRISAMAFEHGFFDENEVYTDLNECANNLRHLRPVDKLAHETLIGRAFIALAIIALKNNINLKAAVSQIIVGAIASKIIEERGFSHNSAPINNQMADDERVRVFGSELEKMANAYGIKLTSDVSVCVCKGEELKNSDLEESIIIKRECLG